MAIRIVSENGKRRRVKRDRLARSRTKLAICLLYWILWNGLLQPNEDRMEVCV